MKCKKCGRKITQGEEFCPYCGEEIVTDKLEEVLPFFKSPKDKPSEPMSTYKRLFFVLVNPVKTFWDYTQRQDRAGPALVFLTLIMTTSLYYIALLSHFTFPFFDVNILVLMLGSLIPLFLFNFVVVFINLIALAAFLHIGVRLVGVKTKLGGTLGVTLYALTPLAVFRLIVVLILWVAGSPVWGVGWTGDLSAYFAGFFASPLWGSIRFVENLILIWVGLVAAIGFKERFDLSVLSAILIASISVLIYANLTQLSFLLSIIPNGGS
ncbi:MAG: YIP1 family protein [Candidatus Ranarchaeia archaeon]|jgi:hypothetical protein